jgi:hypothetical protein
MSLHMAAARSPPPDSRWLVRALAASRSLRVLCRIESALARPAARQAAQRSQGPSGSQTHREPLLLASMRKVTWKASMASCSSRRMPRHVRSTIGPCRHTSASKVSSPASSRCVANRSNSCLSVSPEATPKSNTERSNLNESP